MKRGENEMERQTSVTDVMYVLHFLFSSCAKLLLHACAFS